MQENEAKEARPAARVPPLRYRQPAVLDPGARRRTRCAALPLRSNSCGELDHEAAVSCGTAAAPASALLGTVRRGKREPNTGCAQIAPLAFSSSKLGAAAAHGDYQDGAFPTCFASTTEVQTLFQECELLARILPAPEALLAIRVPASPQN